MSKIDVSQWGEFHLYDLFTIDAGSKLDRKDVNLFPGSDYNYIGRTGDNNGIIGTCNRVNNKKKLPYPAGALTVSLGGTVGATFVQQKPFYTSQNVDVLLPLQSMSDGVKWFVASCIYREAVLNYSAFVKELNKHIKTDFYIKLPITSDGKPDWDYMDNYIAELAARAHKDVSSLNRVEPKLHKINIDNWQKFKIGDVFEKISTKKVSFKALDLPQIPNSVQDLPLVAAGIDNQGRNRYVDPSCATILSNCLTVSANGANSGAVFYQDSDFSILQDAYALQLVDMYKKHRVQNIYLFLASVLTNVLVNNDWINKATWRTVQNKEIYLPIISDGKPNWDYMDNYIAELAARAHQDVTALRLVAGM